MATHSSILAWRISWAEEPDGLIVHRVAKSRTQLKGQHEWTPRTWCSVFGKKKKIEELLLFSLCGYFFKNLFTCLFLYLEISCPCGSN